MFGPINRWWRRRKIKIAREEAEFREWELTQEKLRKREEMKKSKTPWVTIIGENPTEDGLKLELDWNDAFIEMLRAQGYKGISEDQLVGKWLLLLQQQMIAGDKEDTDSLYE